MKFKYLLSIVLVFALCFGVLNLAFADENAEVPEGYTPIYTAEDLNNIRNDLDGKYILMNDIDLSVYENWKPIGTSETPFTGELDGNGNSIFNLTITGDYGSEDSLYYALFAYMTNGAVFDIDILNADINVNYIGSTVESFRAGILVGYANCVEAKNCIVSGNITLNGFHKGAIGGFFGKENMCYPLNCINYADISVVSQKQIADISVGGIAGVTTNDTVSQCCNYGDITVNGIDSSSEARTLKIGGIVGDNSNRGVVSNCFNQGNIAINFCMPSIYAGGITGECCTVENSYNIGRILVPTNFAGFIGGVSGDFWPGGLAILPAPDIENTYYINEGLYPSYIMGSIIEDYDFDNVKTLTEQEFKNQASFVGFDFENVWEMEENGYPILRNQPELPEDIPERPTTTESTTESTTEPSTEPDTETSTESTTESTTEPESTTSPTTEPETTNPDEDDIPFIVRVLIFIWNYIKNIVLNSYEFIITVLA